jgi:hypothetical protein
MDTSTTSEKLHALESRVKASFVAHESRVHIKLVSPTDPGPNASAGAILVEMTKRAAAPDPRKAVAEWSDAFRADISKAMAELDDITAHGEALEALAKYLRGNGAMPKGISPELRSAADTLMQASDPTLRTNAARRIDLAIEQQLFTCRRMQRGWKKRTEIAVDVVTSKHASRFFTDCGEYEAAATYTRKYEAAIEQSRKVKMRMEQEAES